MDDPIKQFSEQEIISAGKKALLKERSELIDNCYRARLIPSYLGVTLTNIELRKLWANY